MIKTYRKKPVEVYVVQWTGLNTAEIKEFCGNKAHFQTMSVKEWGSAVSNDKLILTIDTLEGTLSAKIGDYIVRGITNEFYPCNPDIFRKTYDEISDSKGD